MWDVEDMGCSGCGMLGMLGMWDGGYVGCSGCGMFGMWNVGDVGCSGCGMCDVGCLPRFRMLIYKMPISRHFFINLYLKHSNFYRQFR